MLHFHDYMVGWTIDISKNTAADKNQSHSQTCHKVTFVTNESKMLQTQFNFSNTYLQYFDCKYKKCVQN